jgi:hypothetical protein
MMRINPFLLNSLGLEGSGIDPTLRLRGWHELGREAGAILDKFPDPSRTFVLARRRQTVSELAFYMPGQPVVYRWNGPARHITSQYEIWSGPEDKVGWDALIVIEEEKDMDDGLVTCFNRIEPVGRIDIVLGRGTKRSFFVYRGIGMIKWAAR